jgi:hypothetical protein
MLNSSYVFGQNQENISPNKVQNQGTNKLNFSVEDNPNYIMERDPAWDTFEIISIDNVKEILSKKIIPMLEEMRKENEDVYYQVSAHTKVKILPKSVIKSEEFKKNKNKLK